MPAWCRGQAVCAATLARLARKGDDGEDGNTLLHGERSLRPDGKPGDFWLDVSATDLWGPKVGNRWPGPVHLLSEAARRDRIGGPMQRQWRRPQRPAFFGGVGTGTANQAQPQQGLLPIIGNGQPLPVQQGHHDC